MPPPAVLYLSFASRLIAACSGDSRLVGAGSAPDLILHNGKIVTVDAGFSIAQAVAIRGERFVAVGSNDSIRRLAGASTKSIDLGGRTVPEWILCRGRG